MGSWIENELIELINSDQFRLSIPIQFKFKIFQFNSNSIHAELNWIDYHSNSIHELIRALPVVSPHKGPVMWEMFPFDEVIMPICNRTSIVNEQHGYWQLHTSTGIILGMGSANERWCYNVPSPLTGWAHTQNDPNSCSCGFRWVQCHSSMIVEIMVYV